MLMLQVKLYNSFDNEPKIKADCEPEKEDKVQWMFRTGDILSGAIVRGIVNKLIMTFELEAGAQASVYIQYDNELTWNRIVTKKSMERKSFSIPVVPRRCEKLKLKFEGYGDFKLYQVTRMMKRAGGI